MHRPSTVNRDPVLPPHLARVAYAEEIIEELRRRLDAGDEQMVARSRARDVQKLALRVVDVLEVRIVGRGFDSGLLRQDFVVTRHDRNGAKLEAFGKVHSADSHRAFMCFSDPVQLLRFEIGSPHRI